jgi:hypothetical protein
MSIDNICEICYDRQIENTLECNHGLCTECYYNVNECPYCREPIDKSYPKSPVADLLNPIFQTYYDTRFDEPIYQEKWIDQVSFAFCVFILSMCKNISKLEIFIILIYTEGNVFQKKFFRND